MDLKQEPSDPYEGGFKTEPDVFSGQKEGNEYFVNISKIKEEIDEYLVPKIELDLSDSPEKIHCDSIQQFVSASIKKESDVHGVVDISETKQEDSVKTEGVLLTSYCDLPTLKSESTEYSDNFPEPCSSKYSGKTLKTLKTTANVSKKKKRVYPCLVCKKSFSSSETRSKHIGRHFGKRFIVCKYCGKLLNKIECFRHHFIHVVKNRPRKVCRIHRHLKIHTNVKPFKCIICSKAYKLEINLQAHLKTFHTDEKPYKCHICSKAFKKWRYIKQHLIIHTDKKRFKCDICSKEFKRNCELQRHLISHTSGTPFKCDICSKKFKQKCTLQEHLVIHTNREPFNCDICNKKFVRRSNLHQHLITHTSEKQFVKCDICFKEFKNKGILKGHLIIHSNEKPFKCDICFKEFFRNYNLQQHLIKMHTNEKIL